MRGAFPHIFRLTTLRPMSSEKRGLLVVIDGPAGAGKTTVARALSARLSASLLDTGAIYRSLALIAERRGIAWSDEESLETLADGFPLRFVPPVSADEAQRILFDDEDITSAIRTSHISEGASIVSALPAVRRSLLALQRAIAADAVKNGGGCVAEGRDMGTVVFPHADHKFFLTAKTDERALRRHRELLERGADPSPSVDIVRDEIRRRDERDSSRAVAPLKQAVDAVGIDSSDLDVEGVLAEVFRHIEA